MRRNTFRRKGSTFHSIPFPLFSQTTAADQRESWLKSLPTLAQSQSWRVRMRERTPWFFHWLHHRPWHHIKRVYKPFPPLMGWEKGYDWKRRQTNGKNKKKDREGKRAAVKNNKKHRIVRETREALKIERPPGSLSLFSPRVTLQPSLMMMMTTGRERIVTRQRRLKKSHILFSLFSSLFFFYHPHSCMSRCLTLFFALAYMKTTCKMSKGRDGNRARRGESAVKWKWFDRREMKWRSFSFACPRPPSSLCNCQVESNDFILEI